MSDLVPVDPHAAVRPFLSARRNELEPTEARLLTEHLSRCPECAAEAGGYHRLARGLAAMRELEREAPAGTLDTLLEIALRPRLIDRRPTRRITAAAAGSAGALVATAVVAGMVRARRRSVSKVAVPALRGRGGRRLALPIPVPAFSAAARAR
jgi:predicted anti-sigma-YlaC factor YlaD